MTSQQPPSLYPPSTPRPPPPLHPSIPPPSLEKLRGSQLCLRERRSCMFAKGSAQESAAPPRVHDRGRGRGGSGVEGRGEGQGWRGREVERERGGSGVEGRGDNRICNIYSVIISC